MIERACFPKFTEIVTPATSKDLTKIETLKAEFGITDSSLDTSLTRWLRQASGLIVEFLGREIASEEVRDTFEPVRDDVAVLRLDRWPVTAVASVVEDGTTLSSGDYRRDDATGRLWRLDSDGEPTLWSGCGTKIVVTYTGGYVVLSKLPHAVEQACIDLVRMKYYGRDRDPAMRSEEVPGLGSQAWQVQQGGMIAEILRPLERWRRITVG